MRCTCIEESFEIKYRKDVPVVRTINRVILTTPRTTS